ncbi:MAG: DUF1566 domain-containing protein [Planctomycetes bacterium]|nr:DUF1566 domain-containing protein [Planctomycetota bacterium]
MKTHIFMLIIVPCMAISIVRAWGDEVDTKILQSQYFSGRAMSAGTVSHSLSKYYRKSWAVIIGVNDYEKWPGLEYAISDATDVKQHLEKMGFDEIITLMDHDATKHNITRVLGDRLPRQVQKEDRVLIFFAGHGQTEDIGGRQYGYIIPVDGDIRNYYSSAISMAQVREFSRRIPAKHIYYVIDACYSGLGLSRSGPRFSSSMEGYLEKVTSLPAVQMVTAGGKGEQVLEAEGHGLFTEYFLKEIEGQADADDDGVVTASELGAYLRPSVSKASEQKQTPLFGSLQGEGEFVFLLPAKGEPTKTAILDQEMKKREQTLRDLEKVLRSWEELLKRQENELKRQVEDRNALKRWNEQNPRTLHDKKGIHDQYTEEEKRVEMEPLSPPSEINEMTRLRSGPDTFSKYEIREMVKKRGFRDAEWNPDGDFQNKFEGHAIKGDKVVIDYATGLMFQQSGSSNEMSYGEAIDYVEKLNGESYAGFRDWRIPTVEELASLLEPGKRGVRSL